MRLLPKFNLGGSQELSRNLSHGEESPDSLRTRCWLTARVLKGRNPLKRYGKCHRDNVWVGLKADAIVKRGKPHLEQGQIGPVEKSLTETEGILSLMVHRAEKMVQTLSLTGRVDRLTLSVMRGLDK